MRDRRVLRPQPPDDFHALLEDRLVVVERHAERGVFLPVIAAAGGEIDAPAAQQIEARPLLGDADRMMQRQHRHCRRQPDALRARGDIRERKVGARQHAKRAEMMLADPGRVHPQLLGIQRLVDDVRDQLVRRARIVGVVVVAQGEVAEFHEAIPLVAGANRAERRLWAIGTPHVSIKRGSRHGR